MHLAHYFFLGFSYTHCTFPCPSTLTSLSYGPWVGKFFFLGKTPTVIPRGLQGLGPKGGIGVLTSSLPPSPPVLPSTIMGTHSTSTPLYVQHGVSSPHPSVSSLSEATSSPIQGLIPTHTFAATWRVVCGCCFLCWERAIV